MIAWFFCISKYICKVYEVGVAENKPYIAMQFVDGLSLEQACRAMSLLEKVQLIRDAAEAMHAAHEQGVIHRDLKPSNIMVTRAVAADGTAYYAPVVMDFGLARDSNAAKGLTESGAVIGTPAYMSPEQARGDGRHLDRRTDVYSLGATLYEILTGRAPFEDEAIVNIILKVINEAPPRLRSQDPKLPQALELIVSKCLNKEREQRYPTAKALAADLGRFLGAQRVMARRLSYWYRLRYWAGRNPALATLALALLGSLLGLAGFAIRTRIVTLQRERQAKEEAQLAERLGQEVKDMEWLLRSARQLPLHDVNREKAVIRRRMDALEREHQGQGAFRRRLTHYALGRAHTALQEYPQALAELLQARQAGQSNAELHYALGFVLGKHFERAIHEARLSGGGDWAKKQLKELEPKYLIPAIESLQRSRSMKSDAPRYLDGLIAFYQRDYRAAIEHAQAAQREAPWLYDAAKLLGDIHREQALGARDSGQTELAAREFAAAVTSYEEAASIGRSDGETYEGLAEAWVRQIEMARDGGQPMAPAYAAAMAASDKLSVIEPESAAGPLKKAYAALMTIGLRGAGISPLARAGECLTNAEEALRRDPGNPYASDLAAGCYTFTSEAEKSQGKDPEPLLRKALGLLEPAVARFPRFLWGLNDLANVYLAYGTYLHSHGKPAAKEMFEKSADYRSKAIELDETYTAALNNFLYNYTLLVTLAKTRTEIDQILNRADGLLNKCKQLNSRQQQCPINHFLVYARAAQRAALADNGDLQPLLTRAAASLAVVRKLDGSFLDVEQHAALLHFVKASEAVRANRDPEPELLEIRGALERCFRLAADDVTCRTLDAQQEWVAAEWLSAQRRPPAPALARAREKALRATQSPESNPGAWQVLGETCLRLSEADDHAGPLEPRYLVEGLAALERATAINPNHAASLATRGSLELLRAQAGKNLDPAARRLAAQSAVAAFEQALKNDPLRSRDTAPPLAQARTLAATQ